MPKKPKKQNGIGLLELMLALAIIAMLMVAASKYYKNTQMARKVQIAVESVQALYTAGERWVQDGGAYGDAFTIANLVTDGYLPGDFASSANPWGTIAVAAVDTTHFKATFGTVPFDACNNISAKLTNNFFAGTITCPTSGSADMVVPFTKDL